MYEVFIVGVLCCWSASFLGLRPLLPAVGTAAHTLAHHPGVPTASVRPWHIYAAGLQDAQTWASA